MRCFFSIAYALTQSARPTAHLVGYALLVDHAQPNGNYSCYFPPPVFSFQPRVTPFGAFSLDTLLLKKGQPTKAQDQEGGRALGRGGENP